VSYPRKTRKKNGPTNFILKKRETGKNGTKVSQNQKQEGKKKKKIRGLAPEQSKEWGRRRPKPLGKSEKSKKTRGESAIFVGGAES